MFVRDFEMHLQKKIAAGVGLQLNNPHQWYQVPICIGFEYEALPDRRFCSLTPNGLPLSVSVTQWM